MYKLKQKSANGVLNFAKRDKVFEKRGSKNDLRYLDTR